MPGHPRILLVRTDRLGDVILTLPMLPLLRQVHPEASIALLLNRYTGEIVKGNPYADALLWYDDDNGLVPFGTMLEGIRRERFDCVVVVHPTPRLAWLVFRARIPARIGTGYRWYSFLFNKRIFEHRKDAKRHELEYNINLLKELDCPPPPGEFRPEFGIVIPDSAEEKVNGLLVSLHVDPAGTPVIVHPGSGGSAREWPLEQFEQLVERISAERTVIVTGNAAEAARAERIARKGGKSAVSLAGRLNLLELAALIRRGLVFVSNSTGPLHLAVAVGTAVVGFYPQHAAMSERRWGPYTDNKRVFVPVKPSDCSECLSGSGVYCSCMASIRVDEVVGAVRDLAARESVRKSRSVIHEP